MTVIRAVIFYGSKLYSKQFILFILFGGLAALVNLIAGKFLYDIYDIDIPYTLLVSISAFCGMVVNFSLNYFFNFIYHPRSVLQHFISFFFVSIFGILLTSFFAFIFLKLIYIMKLEQFTLLGIIFTQKFVAHFCSIGVVVFYSFFAHKYISFNSGLLKFVKIFLMPKK
ncbi:MAG: GtrA family protein [Deltaproteobacteria bacterium]|jgi:putative flippase GtrA|nr:GtrA family protein [Deltaproteobacteria bacterium]